VQYELTRQVLDAFEREGVRYVVFGGVAVNLHGLARATQDLDVFIEPTAENVALLKTALMAVFHDPEVETIDADELLGEYPAVQYVPPVDGFHVDILTRLGEAFAYADLASMRVPLGDGFVNVVTPRMLYRMKRDTVRPKDRADAAALRARFALAEDA
jgi:hypothetical protein